MKFPKFLRFLLSTVSIIATGLLFLPVGINAQIAGVFEGSVGIGLDNPSSLLHLKQASGNLSIQLKTGISWTAKLTQSPGSVLSLHNGGEDHFNLLANGHIGIGTTNPEAKLHVGGGGGSQILLDNAGDLSWKSINGNVTPVLTLHSDDNIYLDATSSQSSEMIFRNNPSITERMRIAADGKVGIGTSSPRRQIHSHFADPGSNLIKITNNTTGSTSSDGMDIGVESGGDGVVWMKSNYALKFATNNSSRMFIANDGQVGIGTSTPDARLDINGDIQWTPVTSYISVAPSMFQAGEQPFEFDFLSGGLRTRDGFVSTDYFAPLQIPHGAVLVDVTISFSDDNSLGNYTFHFQRRSLTGTSCLTENIGSITPNPSNTNCQTASIPNVNSLVIDNSTYCYWIRVDVPAAQDGNMYISGARIEYTIDKPY